MVLIIYPGSIQWQALTEVVNRATNPHTLLSTVVRLNRMRILSRIRSRHASSFRASNKPSLTLRLRKLKSLLPPSATASFHQKLDIIIRQLDQVEAMDTIYARAGHTDATLLSLLANIQQLLADHEAEFRTVPYTAGSWTGNDTESLLERIRKVANYATACSELLKVARRYQIFSNIQVAFVDLQQNGPRLTTKGQSDIERLLQTASSVPVPMNKKRAAKTRQAARQQLTGKSRVHAEIQIALFYEQSPEYLAPRVICSPKSACYLCNLFLQLHGKHYVPSTHGRLYDAWRWPSDDIDPQATIPAFAKLLPTFKAMIDAKIQQQMCQPPAVRRADPLESRVDFAIMSPSASTIPSTIRGVSPLPMSNRASEQGADQLAFHPSPDHLPFRVRSHSSAASLKASSTAKPLSSCSSSSTTTAPALYPSTIHWSTSTSTTHTFNLTSQSLRLRLPGLAIDLEHVPSRPSEQAAASETSKDLPTLAVAIDYIHAMPEPEERALRRDHVVDLDACTAGVEVALPEGVAATVDGLVLIKGMMALRIRIVAATAAAASGV